MFYSLSVCIFSAVVFGFTVSATGERALLPSINFCKRNSTNYFNCLKHTMQEAWPQLIKGLPDFDLPPLDPITYEFGKLEIDINLIRGEVKIFNFTFEGLTKTRFVALKAYFLDDDVRVEVGVKLPKITGSGKCDAIGALQGLRLHAKGHFNVTVEDIQAMLILKDYVVNDTWTIQDCHITPSIKKMEVYFEDLFNGNKEFNDLAMTFVNEYWPSLYRIVMPAASKNICSFMNALANRVLSKVPFSTLFPIN